MEKNHLSYGKNIVRGTKMKKLIDQYIYNVTKWLPTKLQEEVAVELRTNIYDMLDEDVSLERTTEVLNDLGDPRMLALSYQNKPNALITGEKYEVYMSMLTTVLIVLGIISVILGVLQGLDKTVGQEAFKRSGVVLGYITAYFIAFEIFGYASITFLFHMDSLFSNKERKTWELADLEEIPAKFKRYTKKQVNIWFSVQLVFGLIGCYLIWKQPTLIFGEEPIIQKNMVNIFFPLFAVSMMFALVVSFMKIKAGKSTLAVAIVNTIYYVVVATFIIVFLLQDTLWTNVVYEHITKQVIDAVT